MPAVTSNPPAPKRNKRKKTKTGANRNIDAASSEAAQAQDTANPAPLPPVSAEENAFGMTPDNFMQGILWSEILGKPVSKRRGRW